MKIAFLTAGGVAPCLSASLGALIQTYNELAPKADLLGYLHGYRGLLLGNSIEIPSSIRKLGGIFFIELPTKKILQNTLKL